MSFDLKIEVSTTATPRSSPEGSPSSSTSSPYSTHSAPSLRTRTDATQRSIPIQNSAGILACMRTPYSHGKPIVQLKGEGRKDHIIAVERLTPRSSAATVAARNFSDLDIVDGITALTQSCKKV